MLYTRGIYKELFKTTNKQIRNYCIYFNIFVKQDIIFVCFATGLFVYKYTQQGINYCCLLGSRELCFKYLQIKRYTNDLDIHQLYYIIEYSRNIFHLLPFVTNNQQQIHIQQHSCNSCAFGTATVQNDHLGVCAYNNSKGQVVVLLKRKFNPIFIVKKWITLRGKKVQTLCCFLSATKRLCSRKTRLIIRK